jgi:hypothetical protein
LPSIGIYELDKDRLKLCVVEAKTDPRPTEFVGKGKQVVIVFQRVTGKAEPETPAEKRAAAEGQALRENRVLQEEVAALRAQNKIQEAFTQRLKDELKAARQEVLCVLKEVDVAQNTIDVMLGGTTLRVDAIALSTSAKFFLDGKECRIDELKGGMRLTLAFGTDAEKSQVVAIRAFSQEN